MFIAPLALLSLVYSRKKKRGKLDTFIILLVLGATLSMSLAACGENPAQVSTPFGTVTGIATQASTSTSTLAVTATLTPYIPTPTGGTAVGTPTLTCTATGMFTNLNTKIIFFGGTNGQNLNDPGPDPSVQTPVWIKGVDQVVPFPGGGADGKKNQANAIDINAYKDVNLIVIGYSGGGDTALIFADKYRKQQIQNCRSGKITDIAILGGTYTGKMTDGGTLDQEWPRVLNNLLVWGTDVYILS